MKCELRLRRLAVLVSVAVIVCMKAGAQQHANQSTYSHTTPASAQPPAQAPSSVAPGQTWNSSMAPPPPSMISNVPVLPPASWPTQDRSPEYRTYEHYFRHVGNLEQTAEQEEQSNHRSYAPPWRTPEQRTLGLTDQQAEALISTAQACNRELQFLDKRIAAMIDAYWKHPPLPARGKFKPSPEEVKLWNQRDQTVTSYIQQLKTAFGEAAFQKLDRYVKWTWGDYPRDDASLRQWIAAAQPQVWSPPRAIPPSAPGQLPPPADAQLASLRTQAQPASNQPGNEMQDAGPTQADDMHALSEEEDQPSVSVRAGDVLPCPVDDDRLSAAGQQRYLTADRAGNVYFTADFCVFKLDSSGAVTRVAGGGPSRTPSTGLASQTFLAYPRGLAVDSMGNLFVALGSSQIVEVTPDGLIGLVASYCPRGPADCPAVAANILDPAGLALDRSGNLYVATADHVEKISGKISISVAGYGITSFSGDAAPATLSSANAVAVDATGILYIADTGNHRVVRVLPDGTSNVIAGGAENGCMCDGVFAWQALLGTPYGVATDSTNNLYIADGLGLVRKVSPPGVITTFVNFYGVGYRDSVFIHDNHNPIFISVASDGQDNIYVYDDKNEQISKVSPLGEVSIVARTITTARKQ